MLDTMTFTKVLGGFCGTFLIFLLGKFVAENLYESHHGDHFEQAYVIETDGGEEDVMTPEEEVDFAALVAEGDAAKGERVFGKCKACHKIEDGANGTGPTLYNVVGREKASVGGFGYSSALTGMAGEAWTEDNLNAFLENPKGYAPGTSMGFAGLKKVEDRANVVKYLAETGS